MSLRLPQSLATELNAETGASVLDAEILAEKAAALGRAGRLVERRLRELAAFAGAGQERARLVQSAADAVHGYLVQRELCGLMRHDDVIDHYAIPREVLARVGSR
ncbi:MAG: hypothetical protein MI785_20960 [Kiloniellales bacterium]|nr:hypothetical protein [Kiloniellales bacterium]